MLACAFAAGLPDAVGLDRACSEESRAVMKDG